MKPKNTRLIEDLTIQRDEILAQCDALENAARRAPISGGQWGVHDVIGHLSNCEGDTLEHITQTFREGRPRPVPPDFDVADNNARESEKRRPWSWERVRAEFVNTRNALIQRVDALNESDLQFQVPSPWVNDARIISLETLIREDVLEHGREHLEELKQYAHDHH